MENTSVNSKNNTGKKTAGTPLRNMNVGLVAHVDAGKTTLSEGMLYLSGSIRKQGRVDHGDTFLDTYELERERGITIFSKQAEMNWKGVGITLLDTPGHVDFSAEMERTLQVLDCAVLVISAADGVQGHTVTLWRLLKQYQIPVFLFINKMDQEGADGEQALAQLQEQLSGNCVAFDSWKAGRNTGVEAEDEDSWEENAAVCDENMLEEYLETGHISSESVRKATGERKIFPCWFGSALRGEGMEELLDGLVRYAPVSVYPEAFGTKVYKISRDAQGTRLTWMKITGGSLRVKEILPGTEEKINQIRIYSGEKYELVQQVEAGRVCAVTGPESTRPGQGLGAEKASGMPVLEPVLTYSLELPEECDVHVMLRNLRQLEEEEPELHILWQEQTGEIHVQLMGEVQTEILKQLIKERYGVLVRFGEGSIVYKETIAAPVEGVGHFEPLRHYAEVHLMLEPGERGSGMQFASECPEDVLDRNWQRLILTHLEEREHPGVLTGSPITDMKITLMSGRAHQKHTEGGDFRQATYRAVRQGLKKAESILLEPWYEFRMEMPSGCVGRAMTDVQRMYGDFEPPLTEGDTAVLTGSAPVSTMRGYQTEFAAYTGGRGRLFCTLKGYDVCHNTDEAVAAAGYDSEADIENPTGSVFCAHGAGFIVPWYEVEDYMHLESVVPAEDGASEEWKEKLAAVPHRSGSRIELTQEELDAIYVRTPDPVKRRVSSTPVTVHAQERQPDPDSKWTRWKKEQADREEYLLVDGYNIIFAWEELDSLAQKDIGAARGKLMDILSNYQGYRKCTLILVFDAYKVEGNPGEVTKYHNIHVVYTKEAETADQYIEKTVRRIAKNADVTVATSDALEQVIILGAGARRMSAAGLREEVELALKEVRQEHLSRTGRLGNYLFDYLDDDEAKRLEQVRLGRKEK